MNVLYHFRTRGTGAEGVHIAGIANAFRRRGFEVDFVSPSGVDPTATKGQSPFTAKSARGLLGKIADHAPGFVFELLELAYNLPAAVSLLRQINAKRPTLIYQRHAFSLFATALLARLLNIPLVLEVNELAGDDRIRSQPLFASLVTAIDRWVLNSADLVCVVSPHLARRAIALGADPARVLTVPNAVGPEMLGPPVETPHRFGLPDSTLTVGFVGWFVPWHDLPQLVHQFAAATARTPKAMALVLVGEGPLRSDLDAIAADFPDIQVVFPGPVAHADMASTMDAFDISIVPACNEFRSPIKLLEYLARGSAVIAPDVEPIREVTAHLKDAFHVDGGDFAGAIATLANDDGLRATLGGNARAKVRTQHTWDMNVQRLLAALSKSLS